MHLAAFFQRMPKSSGPSPHAVGTSRFFIDRRIITEREEQLRFDEVKRHLGSRPGRRTVWEWAAKGVAPKQAPKGFEKKPKSQWPKIKLGVVHSVSCWVTSVQALQRFQLAISGEAA